MVEEGEAQSPALRADAQVPGRSDDRRERGVKPHLRAVVQDPETVWPDDPHAVREYLLAEHPFPFLALYTGFAEAGGYDDERADPLLGALVYDAQDLLGGDHYYREVYIDRHVQYGRI